MSGVLEGRIFRKCQTRRELDYAIDKAARNLSIGIQTGRISGEDAEGLIADALFGAADAALRVASAALKEAHDEATAIVNSVR